MILKGAEAQLSMNPTQAEHAILLHAASFLVYVDNSGQVKFENGDTGSLIDSVRENYLHYMDAASLYSEYQVPLTLSAPNAVGLAWALEYIVQNKHCVGKEIKIATRAARRLRKGAEDFFTVHRDDAMRAALHGLEDQIDMKSLDL